MAEYIDREALLLRLKKVVTTGDDFGLGMRMATSHAIQCIEESPAADVAEVKHGEWIVTEDDYAVCATEFTCSHCKVSLVTSELTDGEFLDMMKYCPNCGAEMDGKVGDKP